MTDWKSVYKKYGAVPVDPVTFQPIEQGEPGPVAEEPAPSGPLDPSMFTDKRQNLKPLVPAEPKEPSIMDTVQDYLGRFSEGFGRSGGEMIEGTVDLAKTLLRPPERGEPALPLYGGMKDIIEAVLSESGRSLGEAKESWKAGDPVGMAKHGVGAIPMVGPALTMLGERLQEDPVKGSGDVAANVLSMFLGGRGLKSKPRTPEVKPSGPIPDAHQFYVESEPPTFLKGIGEASKRSSVARGMVDRAVRRRDEPIQASLREPLRRISPEESLSPGAVGSTVKDQLVEGLTTQRRITDAQTMADSAQIASRYGGSAATPESVGGLIKSALTRRTTAHEPPILTKQGGRPPSIRDIEESFWKPFDEVMQDAPVSVDNIRSVAKEINTASEASRNLILDSLPKNVSDVIRKAANIEGGGPTVPPEYAGLSHAAQAILLQDMAAQGIGQATTVPTFGTLHSTRKAIDSMLSKSRSVLGDEGTRALSILREEVTKSMREAITDPSLETMFDTANAFTKFKHKTFGKGIVGDIIDPKNPKVLPSEIAKELPKLTVEEIRLFNRAIGSDQTVIPEIKTAVTKELFKKHSKPGKGGGDAIDHPAVAHDLRQNSEVYRELLGKDGYYRLLDDMDSRIRAKQTPAAQRKADAVAARESLAKESPENIIDRLLKPGAETDMADIVRSLPEKTKSQIQRVSIEKLIADATTPSGVIDGPKFNDLLTSHRGILEAAGVNKQTLSTYDDIANQIKGYRLSKTAGTEANRAMWETGVGLGGSVAAAGSMISGNPMAAGVSLASTGAILLAPSVLLKIMLEPAGPKLLSRFFQTGRITEPLAKIAGLSAIASPITSKYDFSRKKDEEGETPKGDEIRARR